MRIHLDTDFGGDSDDACALAYLLGLPDVELVGVTTAIDADGQRAAYVEHFLELAGREEIPVASGVPLSLTTAERAEPVIGDERVWPTSISPKPSPEGAAVELLLQSIDQGATIVGIGPYGNLAKLEHEHPGSLARAPVVVMGGVTGPLPAGFPDWDAAQDFNVQWDTDAAETVGRSATNLTLATLQATSKACVRASDLERLRASGPIGELLARQSEARAEEAGFHALALDHPGLPDDLLNFQWDPVACAVATGWKGATIESQRLAPRRDGDLLRLVPDERGQSMRVVTDVDADAFAEAWLEAIEHADRRAA